MPPNLSIGLFVLGAVLILIGFAGGNFKMFGAEVAATISNRLLRFIATVFGTFLLIVAWQISLPSNPSLMRGTVASVNSGDRACYITIDTEDGRREDLKASFDLCDPKWTGKKVEVSVKPEKISNCEGSECNSSENVFLITDLKEVY